MMRKVLQFEPTPMIEYNGLHTVMSGGQTGADQAGLFVAAEMGVATYGYIPTGYQTLDGPNPGLAQFGLVEGHGTYKDRTWRNVEESDGTIRFASLFTSPGEICTLNAIRRYKKPYTDIPIPRNQEIDVDACASHIALFIVENHIQVLNVAGNADRYDFHHFKSTSTILRAALKLLDSEGLLIHVSDPSQS